MTGSSARKLRRHESNLLAGRSLTRKFFPLTYIETENSFNLDNAIKYGMLPKIFTTKSNEDKIDLLRSYTDTYLKEEIQQEALVRNLPAYVKFLKHLALANGNVINLSNLSREAGISRAPLENYMSILTDTLIGVQVEPIHLRAKVKEVTKPKFYFFDCGVVEALSGTLGEKLDERVGNLFETLVLNELRAYSEYSKKHFDINYWGTPSENEVDFICTKGKISVGIEVKFGKKWKSDFAKGLKVLLTENKIKKAIVVYTGEHKELHDNIQLLPFQDFCQSLYNNEII
jgi:predicted AAA+ superfamily ATPase